MRGVLCTAVAVAVLGLGVPVAWAEDRALLVGVGAYARQDPFRDLWGNEANIRIMREVAAHLGFADEQIRVIEDEAATLAGVRRAFEDWLIEAVGPGDRALFYFSGHGHYVPDRDGDEPDGRDEVLVMHDYAGTRQAWTNVLVDDEMNVLLGRLRTGDVLVFLDSCHSGTATMSSAARNWSFFDDDDPGGRVMTRGPAGGTRYMALGAARDEEQALGTGEGAFFTRGIRAAVRESVAANRPLTMNTIREVAFTEILRLHARAVAEDPEAARFEIHEPVLTGDLARADHDLRRLAVPTRPFSHRLAAAVDSAPGRVEVTGARSVYRSGEFMQFEIEMPVDGYLNVLSVVEEADDATVLFPNAWSRRDNRFARGSRVLVPGPDDRFDLPVEPEDPARAEERNVLVVVVSETPLDLKADDVDTVLRVLPAAHATAVPYVVTRR